MPGDCLRLRCSSGSLRISPLHPEFRLPLKSSSPPVFEDLFQLSWKLSLRTWQTACVRFTPNKSGQRLPPTYYRGCWHVVSRGFLGGYRLFCLPLRQWFTSRKTSSHTRRRSVRLSPIAEDSSLLPPVGVGAVSQSPCGWPSSQTSYPLSPR